MKRKVIPPAITRETTEGNARKWLNIARYQESGTVIQLQDDCEYRVDDILSNPALLKSVLGPYYKKYLLAYVPVDQNPLSETIHEALLSLAVGKRLGTRGTLGDLTNTELVSEIARRGYDIGLFISHVSPLLTVKTMQPLIELESLIRMSKNLSVIVFAETDITHPKFAKLADKCSFLYDHIILYPLYSAEDTRQFLAHYATQWEFRVPEKAIDEIVRMSGGHLWIAHQLLRHLRDNPKDTVEDACHTDALMTKLTAIWDKLDRAQKELLKRIAFGTATQEDVLSAEFKSLSHMRFIIREKTTWHLGIPLISHVIENELTLSKWQTKNDRIYIGDKDLTSRFTKKEKLALSILIQSKQTLVTREILAKVIWGDAYEERYSDWAIDRLMYRLRSKLKTLSPNRELIKTAKRKGFFFG